MLNRPRTAAVALAFAAAFWICQTASPPAIAQVGSKPPASRDRNMVDIDAFPAWLETFKATAVKQGVEPEVAERAFADVSFNPRVVQLESYQPEFVRPVWEFLDDATSGYRITVGLRKMREHAELFRELEERFGVPAEIVAAIWGLESGYGSNLGGFNVIESLATVAFGGRRKSFARRQLLAALEVLEEATPGARELQGSWAGALGHTQFIPTTFLAYAIDYDGDGYRDFWSKDPADALGSAASYLVEAGWQKGMPVFMEVTLPADFDYRDAELKRTRPYGAWREDGVRLASGEPLPDDVPQDAKVSAFTPAGHRGPAFLAFENVHALLLYNRANSYVLGVWLLSEQLARRPELRGAWPVDDGALRVGEVAELQRLLTVLGHDTQGADGIVGPRTRAAVRAFQESRQQVPDGHINPALIESARSAAGSGE